MPQELPQGPFYVKSVEIYVAPTTAVTYYGIKTDSEPGMFANCLDKARAEALADLLNCHLSMAVPDPQAARIATLTAILRDHQGHHWTECALASTMGNKAMAEIHLKMHDKIKAALEAQS